MAVAGIQEQFAVYGTEVSVDTAPQPEIVAPPILKSTTPGIEAVAVIVSTVPYVGVDACREIESVGVALVIVKSAVDKLVNV